MDYTRSSRLLVMSGDQDALCSPATRWSRDSLCQLSLATSEPRRSGDENCDQQRDRHSHLCCDAPVVDAFCSQQFIDICFSNALAQKGHRFLQPLHLFPRPSEGTRLDTIRGASVFS
jgi:hypothetical protein